MKRLLVIFFFILIVSNVYADSATFQVAATADDGHNDNYYGFITNNVRVGRVGTASNPQNAFFRWTNVTIPKGSTITTAILKVYANSFDDGTKTNIYFNASDNAVAPTSTAEYNALSVGSAVVWNPSTPPTGWNDSPEIKTILQAVIDRSGWSSGNAVQILWKDNASTSYKGGDMNDYAENTSYAAKLYVEWTPPAVTFVPKITIF